MRYVICILCMALLLAGCAEEKVREVQVTEEMKEEQVTEEKEMLVIESVFSNGERIPKKYTCDDQDISPPIVVKGISKDAKTIAIIVDDPDAPMGVFTHWLIWNIPAAETIFIPEGISKTAELSEPFRAIQGKNDFNEIGYDGPCPPSGEHTYRFKIYVLDAEIDLEAGKTKGELLKAMEGHVIQYGELRGVYKRLKN